VASGAGVSVVCLVLPGCCVLLLSLLFLVWFVCPQLPGLGMLVNFHPVLHNILPGGLSEDPVVNRSNPSAGSFTAYHNCTFIATTDIHAGQEMFGSVADDWYAEHVVSMPVASDFKKADDLVKDLQQFRTTNSNIDEATMLNIIYRIKNEIVDSSVGMRKLIPDSLERLEDFAERGTAMASLLNRGEQWLKENGMSLVS